MQTLQQSLGCSRHIATRITQWAVLTQQGGTRSAASHSHAEGSTPSTSGRYGMAPSPLPQRDLFSHHQRPKALFLDAAGTFLIPSEGVADVYLRYGAPYGVTLTPQEVLSRFRSAYNDPWTSPIRYDGDGRPFWRTIVQKSLDCQDEHAFEDIYRYYERPEAWKLAPGLERALAKVRAAGIKVCVVSNFDSRLRPLLEEMGLASVFDHVVVSAEVGAEKPSPRIFREACRVCGVDPDRDIVVHVGDDRRNDINGARDVGIYAWLWGIDVQSFDEIAERCVSGDLYI